MSNSKIKNFYIAAAMLLSVTASQAVSEPKTYDLRFTGIALANEFLYELSNLSDDVWQAAGREQQFFIAQISAPVGFNNLFTLEVENYLYEAFSYNPRLRGRLSKCLPCMSYVSRSNHDQTSIVLGFQDDQTRQSIVDQYGHMIGISLNFEGQEDVLTLRAALLDVSQSEKIIWAKRYDHNQTSRVVLQSPAQIIDHRQALRIQNDILAARERVSFVTRLTMRQFNLGNVAESILGDVVPPLLFFEQYAEVIPDHYPALRIGGSFGFTSLKGMVEGWSAGFQTMKLIMAKQPHFSSADFYGFFSMKYLRLRGPVAAVLGNQEVDVERLLNEQKEPNTSLVALRYGLETHVKFLFGVMAFLEYIPALDENDAVAREQLAGIFPYHNIGGGLVIKW